MKIFLLTLSVILFFACSNGTKKNDLGTDEIVDQTEDLESASTTSSTIDTSIVSIKEYPKTFGHLYKYQKSGLESDLKATLQDFKNAANNQPNITYYQIIIGLIHERLNSPEAANSSYEIAIQIAEKNLKNPWPIINMKYGVGSRSELNKMINDIPDHGDLNAEKIIRSCIAQERIYLLGAKILLRNQETDLLKFKTISERKPAAFSSAFDCTIKNRKDFFKLIDEV